MHMFGWAEIDALVELIAERAAGQKVEAIVGIARSGLVPAVMLSHRIGVRPFSVIDIARTTSDAINASKSAPVWHGISNRDAVAGRRVLLIDDIVGHAMTMPMAAAALRDLGADPVTATLVVNQHNLGARAPRSVVDIYGCVVYGWVVFPWEGKDDVSHA
jgi:hypoxanthine phosphoribosyltransferase